MIDPGGAVRVLLATNPIDFGKGAESLIALVRETMVLPESPGFLGIKDGATTVQEWPREVMS